MRRSMIPATALLLLCSGAAHADSHGLYNKADTTLLIRSAGIKPKEGSAREDYELLPNQSRQFDLGMGYHMVQFVVYNKANMGECFFCQDWNMNEPNAKWTITVDPGIKVERQKQ